MNTNTFSVGTNDQTNAVSDEYIAYIFADNPEAGIKCGGYTGNSGTTVVRTGFKVGWVLIKVSNRDDHWIIHDNTATIPGQILRPNLNATFGGHDISFDESDGFIVNGTNLEINQSGGNYIYVAIAEQANRTQLSLTDSSVTDYRDDSDLGMNIDETLSLIHI